MNILLIQLKRIGDLILTTPAVSAIRQTFPDATITLVVSTGCSELLPAIPNIDTRYVIRRSPADIAILLAIARTRFDACIDFTRNKRSAVLTWLSRARKRIGSHRIQRRAPLRRRAYTDFVPGRMRDQHMIDYNLSLLQPLGIRGASPALRLVLPAETCHHAVELCRKAQIQQPFVIFHPGSARPEKFWEAHLWAEVITAAVQQWHFTAVLTAGPSPQEKMHLAGIESHLPRPEPGMSHRLVVDLSGKIDLLTLAALIAQAKLLVTVDSAPMHIAAATNTPQIVLFGPTNPFHWRPRNSPAVILQGGSVLQAEDFAPRRQGSSMKLISTQSVIDAMNSLLSMPTARGL
jgi:predicted lipopolysaccharide heptosyltransferase III